MTKDFIIFIQFIIITICINSILLNRYKTDKLLTSLENMIDSALKGSFTEKVFDESLLSALETKFAQYLSGQTCSTQNIMHEKDSIKTLIADISHQTKTPVANILLYCELLLEDELSENSKNNLMALYSQTKKLRFLLETGIISLSPKKQEIQPLLDKIFIQYNQKADSKDLHLNTVKTDATAVFDEKWTLEALCNIVDNAIKYTVTGGISINVIVYEFFVRIDISDTGIGISDNEHEKVFSRFYRSEKVNTTEGVGIGLYLARKIITGENGYIKVSSLPEHGSTFSVFLSKL